MYLLLNIDVADLDRGVRFYEAALGLRYSRSLFDGGAAEMLGAGCRLYLIERAEPDPAPAGAAHPWSRHWTPIHPDFVVQDIATATARAVTAGALQETPIRPFEWGQLVTLSDPFGNGFCLIEFVGEPYEVPATPERNGPPAR
ncbi:VOC family protein [Stutzerimonas stutzeri]